MRKSTIISILFSFLIIACAPQQIPAETDIPAGSKVIEITESGFSPNPLTIKQGETVTWVNKNTKDHWVASAQHPTHEVYPGSSIKKCGSGEAIFDACRRLAQGETFTFTFNEKGEWNYHDHLNVGQPYFGKIIVE